MSTRGVPISIAVGIVFLLAGSSPALGQSWITGTNGTWSTATRWNPAGVPVSGSSTVLTFASDAEWAFGMTSTNNLAGTFLLNELVLAPRTFTRVSLEKTAASSGLQLVAHGGAGPFITMNGTGLAALRQLTDLAATVTIRGTGSATLWLNDTASNGLTGSGGVVVQVAPEAGVNLFSNVASTLSGGITLQSGNLIFTGNNAFGAANTVVINGGNIVSNNTSSATVANNIVANADFRYYSHWTTNTQADTFSGVVSGNGDFINLGLLDSQPLSGTTTPFSPSPGRSAAKAELSSARVAPGS
jgi:hypothetical protein